MSDSKRLTFPEGSFSKVTHYLFRYPAKFFPPVARALIEKFSEEGDTVLDPFCGSGTVAVESQLLGRNAVGSDIDPVAIFVSQVKNKRFHVAHLRRSAVTLLDDLGELERTEAEYERRQWADVTWKTVEKNVKDEGLWVPEIPNIQHWFRNYVVTDLARILQTIDSLEVPMTHKDVFRLCFASIIRNSSNADPVPVSGLEVTSHMLKKEKAGRIVNPFVLFSQRLVKYLDGVEEFCDLTKNKKTTSLFIQSDATGLSQHLEGKVSALITSPPYHSAVDYYRRHTLEMYWLGFTETHEDRLDLLPKYIGRSRVPRTHEFVMDGAQLPPTVKLWERKVREVSDERADALKHYAVAMRKTFKEFASFLVKGGRAVLVVGKSKWGNARIPTDDLFSELAGEWFKHTEDYWYPIKNRYMSYSRHNGADINQEHVIVLTRK
jgi:tRNA G10  N-methylase Trm11